MHRRLEQQLIELQIEPAVELESGVTNGTAWLEAQLPVQRNAGGILRVDARDQIMVVLPSGRGDQLDQQSFADALAAMQSLDVDRVFDGVLVRWPVAKRSVSAEAEQPALIGGRADDRKGTVLL